MRHTWPAGHWTVGVIASLPDTYGSAARVFDVDGRGSSQVPTPVSTQPPNSGGGAPAKDDGAGGGGGGKGSGTGTGGKNAPADGAKDAPTKGNTPSRSSQGTGRARRPRRPAPRPHRRGADRDGDRHGSCGDHRAAGDADARAGRIGHSPTSRASAADRSARAMPARSSGR
ncbi:MAG: hypothetical protein PGN13_05685 [Patulibacter minatonensis]